MEIEQRLEKISSCPDIDSLAMVSRQVDELLAEMVDARVGLGKLLATISALHHGITCRIIQLTEEKLVRTGPGPAPLAYCWINMGSAARNEQTFRTDQDNGLVFEDCRDSDLRHKAGLYFQNLAESTVKGLKHCGFALCPGGVMAVSDQWRGPLERWQSRIGDWMNSVDPRDTRRLTILLDFQPVWGDMRLGRKLRRALFSSFAGSLAARHMLSNDDHTFSVPLGLLGTLVTEKSGPHQGLINLKTAGIIHLVNGIRLLAVQNRIAPSSTLERVHQLEVMGVLSTREATRLRTSFETLMKLKIQENLKQYRQGREPDNYLDPTSLTRKQRSLLKAALAEVARLQKRIEKDFKVPWLRFFGS